MSVRKTDFKLPKVDDLFTTQEQRDEEALSKIRDIELSEIDSFPDHPFRVNDDEDMMQLVASIRTQGIITPATVRQKDDGRYELISGHRRKRACEIAGMSTLRCEVVDLDKDAATVLMVESNFQRSVILPSEKAFAYKMRLEAMNRQGKRTDLTSVPVGQKLSREGLSVEMGESQTQIQRYIRLTYLIPEILDMVDEGKIRMRPAVELSYIDETNQRIIHDEILANDATPSHAQSIRLRKSYEAGTISASEIAEIMAEEKGNQKERIVFSGERIRKFIPKTVSAEKTEDYICKALEYYAKYLKNRNREER